MHLGIEIGGTKLQLGVGEGHTDRLEEVVRLDIKRSAGAAGILDQIVASGQDLIARHAIEHIGIGFGGPVDMTTGTVVTSHQVSGWDGFALSDWCASQFGIRATIGNDCDVAAIAEAKLGAGRGCRSVLYVTVGTGIGGGFVTDGQLLAQHRLSRAEIGHLRPGLDATDPHDTVEARAAGPGIANAMRSRLATMSEDHTINFLRDSSGVQSVDDLAADPLELLSYVTARDVALGAEAGNAAALATMNAATRTLGWAIAQALTLTSAEIVVVGGGVSLAGEAIFFKPLREAVESFVFPPLKGDYVIAPAQLGEEVVLHGALALVAQP